MRHLRHEAANWMRRNADAIVWEGMRFKDIALHMSSVRETFSEHVARMGKNAEWVDGQSMGNQC